MRYIASWGWSLGDEIVIFGIFVHWVSESLERHVPGSIPSNVSGLWSENDLVSGEGGSLWRPSEVPGLGKLPESGLTELVLMSWNDLGMRVSEGAVVPDIL